MTVTRVLSRSYGSTAPVSDVAGGTVHPPDEIVEVLRLDLGHGSLVGLLDEPNEVGGSDDGGTAGVVCVIAYAAEVAEPEVLHFLFWIRIINHVSQPPQQIPLYPLLSSGSSWSL